MMNRIIAVFIAGLLCAPVLAKEPKPTSSSVFLETPQAPEIMEIEKLDLKIERRDFTKKELEKWDLKKNKNGHNSVEYDAFRYFLEFNNTGDRSLTNLVVRYCCYYKVDQFWDAESKTEESLKFYSGEMGLRLIAPRERVETETEPFVLVSSSLQGDENGRAVDGPNRVAEELVGLCVQVLHTTSDGTKLRREFWDLGRPHSAEVEIEE